MGNRTNGLLVSGETVSPVIHQFFKKKFTNLVTKFGQELHQRNDEYVSQVLLWFTGEEFPNPRHHQHQQTAAMRVDKWAAKRAGREGKGREGPGWLPLPLPTKNGFYSLFMLAQSSQWESVPDPEPERESIT